MAIFTSINNLLTGTTIEWARIEFKETWDAEASHVRMPMISITGAVDILLSV